MQTTAFLGVAHSHTPHFARLVQARPDVRVKYVFDHQAPRAQKVAASLGAEVAGLDAILADSEVSSVLICSETRHHVALVERAVASGKHLFVEKPLAFDGDAADKLATLIEQAGVVFQTGFANRGHPEIQFLRQQVAQGNLGTITRMRYPNCHQGVLARWFDGDYGWFTDPLEAGGGAFADLGAHALDILLWVMVPVCGPPMRYAATVGNATNHYGPIDEWGTGTVTFQSGAAGTVEASWVDPKLRLPIEVHGTRGQILIDDGRVRFFSELVEGADGGEWADLPAALPHAFELFWDKLEGRDVPLVPVREAALESRVMHELYRAAQAPNGVPVV